MIGRSILYAILAILFGSILQSYFFWTLQLTVVAIENGRWFGWIEAPFHALNTLPLAVLGAPIKIFAALMLLIVAKLLEAAFARAALLLWMLAGTGVATIELVLFQLREMEITTIIASVGAWMMTAALMRFVNRPYNFGTASA